MNSRSNLRLSALVAGLLFGVGYCLVVVVPGGGDVSEQDFTDFYASDGRQFAAFGLFFALVAGCLAATWFFNELRAALPESVLTRTAGGAAAVGSAAVAIGAAILTAPIGAQQNSDFAFVGAPIAEVFAQAGLGVMLAAGMLSLALAMVLANLAVRRSGLGPAWLSIAGIAAGVIMVGSYIWLPGLVFPIWLVATGAVGMKAPSGRPFMANAGLPGPAASS